jgi:hypothetical protein
MQVNILSFAFVFVIPHSAIHYNDTFTFLFIDKNACREHVIVYDLELCLNDSVLVYSFLLQEKDT